MKLLKKVQVKICLTFGALLTSLALVSCGKSFSTKLKNIELGTSQEEVEKKLGKPDDKNDVFGEKWYYLDKSFRKKYEAVTDLLENAETEADLEKADKLYTEMEKMTYKCTMINFNSNKEVTEVFYDTKHKYEESNDYATISKTLSEVELSISDIQYYVEKTDEGSSTKFINANNSLSYKASFSDGSYINSYANGVKTTLEGNSAVVTWKDEISDYKVNKKANKIGTLNKDGTFTIEYAKGDLVLPSVITKIDDEMFLNNTDLTSIVIPNSVKTIGKNAFKGCNALTSITISNSVVSIEDGAFEDCKSLKNVTIETGSLLTHIGKEVFKNTSVNFEIIDGGKYLSCGDNKNFALISIDSEQQNFTIKTLTSVIADDVFDNFQGNSVNFETDGIKFTKTNTGFELTKCLNNSITSLVVPNFITSIKAGALENCTQLESITIPFVGAALNGTDNTHFGYIFGASDWNYNSKYVPNGLKKVIITGGTSIGEYAFKDCSSLTSIVIPNSVTNIGNDAFRGCSSLQYNEYGNCLYLGNDENPYLVLVKSKDTTIKEATISNNTKFILNSAFYDCSSLSSVTIPDSVSSIGSDAFYYCKSLTIYCEANSKPSGWDSYYRDNESTLYFGINESNCIDGVMYGLEDGVNATAVGYTNDLPNNAVILSYITVNGTSYDVTGIGADAFKGCNSLTSIVIPNSVTSIGTNAFEGCSSLTSIVIPNSVTEIGKNALNGCSSLKSMTLPFVGYYHFGYIFGASSYLSNSTYVPNSLTEVIITGGESIGQWEFYGCSSLTSIVIPNSVTSIESSAFASCSSLTSITIPNSVTSIESSVFAYCSSLTSITIPNSVTSIKTSAFEDCRSLTSIVIPNSVTYIDHNAFRDCASLTSIAIPNSVKYIGEYAFQYCESLSSITIPNSLKSIHSYAFSYCSSLTSIVISNSVTSIGTNAFLGCSSLTIYCEANSKPSIWYSNWNGIRPVYWGVTQEDIIYQNGLQFLITNGNAVITGHTNELSNNVVIPTTITVGSTIYNMTSIGDRAFQNCSSLTSITIPNSIASIGESAFVSCSSLTSTIIPNGVTSIGDRAFQNCSSLTSIIIPNGVTSIGEYAFNCCKSLTIYCEESSQPSGWDSKWNDSTYANEPYIPVRWSGTWSYVNGIPTPNK